MVRPIKHSDDAKVEARRKADRLRASRYRAAKKQRLQGEKEGQDNADKAAVIASPGEEVQEALEQEADQVQEPMQEDPSDSESMLAQRYGLEVGRMDFTASQSSDESIPDHQLGPRRTVL